MPLPFTKAKNDAIKAVASAHVDSIKASMESGKTGNKYVRPVKSTKDMLDAGAVTIDIHEYVSEAGSGWDAVMDCIIDGVRYVARLKGSGPENRESDWIEQPPVR